MEEVSFRELNDITQDFGQRILEDTVDLKLQDDRFEKQNKIEANFLGVGLATESGPIGFIGGNLSEGVLRLDSLAKATQEFTATDILKKLYQKVKQEIPSDVEKIELWGRPWMSYHTNAVSDLGLAPSRHLIQMRCDLSPRNRDNNINHFIHYDLEEIISVNNSAFINHPDQSNLTIDRFEELASQSWYDPENILIYREDKDIAGFCWIKPHPKQSLGEIYAIAVNPKYQGRGHGKLLLESGLSHIYSLGFGKAMLYVEADNEKAYQMYLNSGFLTHHEDKAYYE